MIHPLWRKKITNVNLIVALDKVRDSGMHECLNKLYGNPLRISLLECERE